MKAKCKKSRLAVTFTSLVAIDSESFHESEMATRLTAELKSLGFTVTSDEEGKRAGSDTGNIYAILEGSIEGEPLLFSAHMDTVRPGKGKEPVIGAEGVIKSKGDTVLGADDAAGLTAILEAVRTLRENNIPHRTIEVIFPVAEEAYVRGSSVFDYTRVRAKEAYVLDLEAPIGTASLGEPTLISFQINICGRASHAGFAPEQGINSIAIAADMITKLSLGRVDDDTTLNIGQISGGTATNIVPECTTMRGEIRSYIHEKAKACMDEVAASARESASKYGGSAQVTSEIHLTAYNVSEDEPVVRHFREACHKCGIETKLIRTFGGSDNNSFLKHGIRGIVLACGMHNVHTTEEYSTLDEIEQSTQILMELMQLGGKDTR
jgi:tripeptide aminopeptidase